MGQQDSTGRQITLYFKKWIPETRKLDGGLNINEAKGLPHAQVKINSSGLIKKVDLINKNGEQYLSYRLSYNKNRTWAKYWIEAQIDTPLTVLNDLLFAHDLSDLRKGYRILVDDRKNGDIESLKVFDHLASFLYYYEFDYKTDRQSGEQTIISSYFKYDSVKVGFHVLKFDKRGRLKYIDYYDKDNEIKYSLGYQYSSDFKDITRSMIDSRGNLLEKRLLPFHNKYLRRPVKRNEGVSLSTVIEFLENAQERDIDSLADILEQRYRKVISRVDTTFSPIKNIIDTLVVEKNQDQDNSITPQKIKESKNRIFSFGLEAGTSILRGSYFDGTIPAINGFVTTHDAFKITFLPSIKPYLDLNYYNILNHNYYGFKVGLIMPGTLPFGVPFQLNGGVGRTSLGNEVSGGLLIYSQRSLRLGIKVEAHLVPGILGSNKVTGWVSLKFLLGI